MLLTLKLANQCKNLAEKVKLVEHYALNSGLEIAKTT